MNIIRKVIDTFAIGGLMISSIGSGFGAFILAMSVVFNFSPYFTNKNGGGFGLGGYEKGGIPFEAKASYSIPDTSIYIRTKNGSSFSNMSYKYPTMKRRLSDSILYADTIITAFENQLANDFKVLGASVERMKVYIKPSSIKQRVILNLPMILKLALLSYCCWQLGMLLSYINSGKSFQFENYKRLNKTGWSIVIVFLLLLIYNIIISYSEYISIDFISSIENYRSPFKLQLHRLAGLDISWLITGCVFIIISLAFYKGNKLQQEQDLTV